MFDMSLKMLMYPLDDGLHLSTHFVHAEICTNKLLLCAMWEGACPVCNALLDAT